MLVRAVQLCLEVPRRVTAIQTTYNATSSASDIKEMANTAFSLLFAQMHEAVPTVSKTVMPSEGDGLGALPSWAAI